MLLDNRIRVKIKTRPFWVIQGLIAEFGGLRVSEFIGVKHYQQGQRTYRDPPQAIVARLILTPNT